MQSKKLSLIETVTNVVSGFAVGIATQIAIFPFYGLKVSFLANLSMTFIFALTSFVRSYIVRRIFNRIAEKQNEASSNECRDHDSQPVKG